MTVPPYYSNNHRLFSMIATGNRNLDIPGHCFEAWSNTSDIHLSRPGKFHRRFEPVNSRSLLFYWRKRESRDGKRNNQNCNDDSEPKPEL
jgi:hypothetical protein